MGFEILFYSLHHTVEVGFGELGVERQADGFVSQAFAVREVTRFSSQSLNAVCKCNGLG